MANPENFDRETFGKHFDNLLEHFYNLLKEKEKTLKNIDHIFAEKPVTKTNMSEPIKAEISLLNSLMVPLKNLRKEVDCDI